jgi:hypothetical protein
LQQEFSGVAINAVDFAGTAANLAQRGSQHATPLVRSTRQTIQSGACAVVCTAGDTVRSTRHLAGNAIEQHFTMRFKRVWHLFLMSILLCWAIPIVVLRPYHPWNSVVANLGLVWGFFWVVCPPRPARHRGKRMAMLMLWPLFLVALPLGVRYSLAHPLLLTSLASAFRRRCLGLRGGMQRSMLTPGAEM